MAIKPKPGAIANIQSRSTHYYDPATFSQHIRPNFIEVTAEELLEQITPMEFDFLPGRRFIAYDTETYYTGVPSNRMPSNVVRRFIQRGSKTFPNDFPFCMSFSDGVKSYVVYDTLENGFKEFKKLEPLLSDTSIDKIAQNFGYDLHMTANCRINIKGRLHDTMYASKLTRAMAFTHNLADIADELCCNDYPTCTVFERMLDAYKSQYRITDYRMFPKELMTQYTAADTWNAIWSFAALYPRLIENEQIPIYDTECEMMLVAYNMERRGVLLDPDYQYDLIPELQREADEAERAIYEAAGTTFNINSSQQLYNVLCKLGYGKNVTFKKPTENMLAKGITKGNPKLDKFEMERMENEGVPLIEHIQKFRAAEKLLNTFAVKLYEMCDFENVVHCSINTIEAKTGRFSISNPSMQNMPRRKDSRVRGAFVAPEDYTLYDFDFKAQESFILIHYARPVVLMEYLAEGKEIHRSFAVLIYGVPYEEVTKALRDISKSVEFAIVYGAGPGKVAAMTGLSMEEASMAMTAIKRNIPEIDIFIRTANTVAKEKRMVRTRMNRHVYVERGREYACVNYVIQGSAADSTKMRMVAIHKFLRANNYKTYMSLQVHDSLLQNVHKDEESFILGYLRWLQTERDLFRVTITVDVSRCYPTWRDKEELDIPEVEPPEDQLEKMRNHDIWSEGIL